MKERSHINNKSQEIFGIEAGFSTLEILIAMVILVFTITAVILVLFGGQTLTTDAQTNQEAIYKAQEWLESARGSASLDFDSVGSILPTNDDIYTRELIVDTGRSTNCQKEVISKVTWNASPTRPQKVELTTDFSNPSLAFQLAGDCPSNPPVGTGNDLIKMDEINLGGDKSTGLDVLNKMVYLTLDSNPGFVIIDATTPGSAYKASDASLSSGVNDIDAVSHVVDNKTYAYVASDRTTSPYKQLLVFDVTDKFGPFQVASVSLPGVTGSCPYTCPQGRSIFFFDDKVYIGTHRLSGASKHEFHVYDVADPTSPQWLGSAKIDHNVNDIYVTKQNVAGVPKTVAYLATSANPEELIVLDVSTPSLINQIASLDVPSSSTDAISLDLDKSKNLIYLGKDSGSGSELFAIDIQTLPVLISANIKSSANVGNGVVAMRIVGKFAYLGTDSTTSEFQVWNSNPATLTLIDTPNISNKVGTGVDYEDHFVYVSFQQGSSTLVIFKVP